jgi:hypothetical protein
MQPTTSFRVPHVRDGFIVANVGKVSYSLKLANPSSIPNPDKTPIPHPETR